MNRKFDSDDSPKEIILDEDELVTVSTDEIVPYIKEGEYGNHPSKRGLLPKDAYILMEAESYTTDKDKYNYFVRVSCGITDAQERIKKLEGLGLIRRGTSYEDLGKAVIPRLKEIARKYSLKVSGNKGQILERLYSNLTKEQINAENIPVYWKYTEEGRQELQEHRYLNYFMKENFDDLMDIGLDVNALNEAQYNNPDIDFFDLSVKMLKNREKEIEEEMQGIKPGPYKYSDRFDIFNQIQEYLGLLKIDEKYNERLNQREDAILAYLYRLYMGVNYLSPPYYEDFEHPILDSGRDWSRIKKMTLDEISDKMQHYGLSANDLYDYMSKVFKYAEAEFEGKMPAEMFLEMIKLELEHKEEEIAAFLRKNQEFLFNRNYSK